MPSKSRGLRTSTGCLTCRKRRVKCDEEQPHCKNCLRIGRACVYPYTSTNSRGVSHRSSVASETEPQRTLAPEDTTPLVDSTIVEPTTGLQSWGSYSIQNGDGTATAADGNSLLFDDSLLSIDNVVSPSLPLGPFEWYDLLAEDAITNIREHNASGHVHRWDFNKFSLSRKQTPRQSPAPEISMSQVNVAPGAKQYSAAMTEPWNTITRISLSGDEHLFFDHYVTVVGPILDLFDPARHFSSVVPHLALRNTGLLRSLLAVGACHMALCQPQVGGYEDRSNAPLSTPASNHSNPGLPRSAKQTAEQYYYETLHHLSQNLLYPSYTSSHEILATAIMISTYEMFGASSSSDTGNWERHLRGAFWIQRNQDNDGESFDGLRRAVWWAWLRQDIWAAFRVGRSALTIWQPKKALSELTSDELETRVIYIAAKCVQFAAMPKDNDIAGYIEAGESLLRILENWKRALPPSFDPIPINESHAPPMTSVCDASEQFTPIWIHPPSHAAAIQMYHLARIIIVLNQPSVGGLARYQYRSKSLRESMSTICGITSTQHSQNRPSAFVNFQAVYAAALCAETQGKQAEVLSILEKALKVCDFPAQSMINDLLNLWGSAT